ncbi:MAG: alpha/beta hydrolase [Bacteroidales bacterium]
MTKSIKYKDIPVYYTVEGEGMPLLFLHGYLESSVIWSDFASGFTNKYKVICVDIPGHGKSGILGSIHSMEDMAEVVGAVLDAEGAGKVVLFGHSMGGYLTMEFVSKYPGRTAGYCLFHSTCFADNEEKKLNREREISLVQCGKKMQIIHTNIPKGFADKNLDKLEVEIRRVKEIASGCPDEGIIALLNGMKARKDHTPTLKRDDLKSLFIWGERDNYIGESVFRKMTEIAPHASVLVLKNSGHMGFIEEPEEARAGIIKFLDQIQ